MEFLIKAFALSFICSAALAQGEGLAVYEGAPFTPVNGLDDVFLKSIEGKNLAPGRLCSDSVFLRRAWLDVTGAIPTPEDAEKFLEKKGKHKREKLIDELLAGAEYSEYAAFKFADIFKIKAEFPINLWPNAAQAYHKYFTVSLDANKPYDVLARELLCSNGSNFKEPAVNFYRAMQGRGAPLCAASACAAFMGVRFDKLDERTQAEFSKFFSKVSYKDTKEWKEEIVYLNPLDKKGFDAEFFGEKITVPDGADPREYFYSALVKHPLFAKNFANRVYGRLTGNYLTGDPDDMLNAEVFNPQMLDYLAGYFVKSGYDVKKLYELILKSNNYAQSSIIDEDEKTVCENFLRYRARQLEAEVLIDAICRATGTTEVYSSMIPEPYTTMPTNRRAVTIPDGSISTPFLELFGKSQRDTGLEMERDSSASVSQRLHLLNSSHIRNKLERSPTIKPLIEGELWESVDGVYMLFLSRHPSKAESDYIRKAFRSGKLKRNEFLRDVAWALMNSEEFLNRH